MRFAVATARYHFNKLVIDTNMQLQTYKYKNCCFSNSSLCFRGGCIEGVAILKEGIQKMIR